MEAEAEVDIPKAALARPPWLNGGGKIVSEDDNAANSSNGTSPSSPGTNDKTGSDMIVDNEHATVDQQMTKEKEDVTIDVANDPKNNRLDQLEPTQNGKMCSEIGEVGTKEGADNGLKPVNGSTAEISPMQIDKDAGTGKNDASLPTEGEAVDEIQDSVNGSEQKDSEVEAKAKENSGNNGQMEEGMEGILEGIVSEDGQMEVDLGDDQYLESLAEQIPAASPGSSKKGETVANSPRKMIASKSVGVTKKAQTKKPTVNDDDVEVVGPPSSKASVSDDDNKKPAATLEEKKKSIEEFNNGAPKTHKIKASKMVNLKKAQESASGTPEDAIVLSSSEDEDPGDGPSDYGIKDTDDAQDLSEGDQQGENQKDLDLSNPSDENKKRPVQNSQGGVLARDIEIGARVYCEFSANKRYYWGKVVGRKKKKKSRYYKYHVRFDDGDEETDMSSTRMVTVSEYIASFGEDKYKQSMEETESGGLLAVPGQPSNPSPAAASQPAKGQSTSRMTTKDLLKQACGKCENCLKPSCGSCGICKVNGYGDESRCCYQKMCIKIPEQAKLQSYTGLPEGMGFCFKERESNPQYEGLILVSKGGRKYKSFEMCFFSNRPDEKTIEDFYSFVGLKDRYKGGWAASSEARTLPPTQAGKTTQPGKSKTAVRTMSPRELWVERCGTCQNCSKPDCGRCICCRGNKRSPEAPQNCCYQKMCMKIDMARKAQPAPATFGNFPPGWKFVFDVPRPEQPHLNGLLLLPPPPNALKYFSVEKAVRHQPKVLAKVDKDSFYNYLGLTENDVEGKAMGGTAGRVEGEAKRPANVAPSQSKPKKPRVVPADVQTGLSLRQLYEQRCKNCVMCKKPSCTQCNACRENASHTRTYKDVCMQKMCLRINDKDKTQTAMGFPEGWRFYYTDPGLLSWHASGEHTGLAGLVLLSPTGREFNSVESAEEELDSDDGQISTIARTFYRHVGCHAVVSVPDHVLVGKPFRQRWIDLEGKTKMVYGKVVDVSEDLLAGGMRTCTVEFSEKSRSLLNAGYTSNGASVPPKQKIPQTLAFGGCLDYDVRAVRFDRVPFHLSWQVPDVRHEDFVVDEHGMFAPRLTMQYKGFHLVFTAKTSTIPNGGKGVFLSCSTLTGSSDEYFMLNAGELLDLGIYAPFRRADNKNAHVFLMKNFIHSSKCEEWNFDTVTDDNLFDITDDATGKLHEIASRHIPAYVNETDGRITPSVFAQHDPAGCVHYLLGHAEENDGPFTLQANGVEQEIFIDYGEQYEDVRIRKNYSRWSEEDAAERRRQLDLDYKEVLEEIKTYNATEIIHCVNFMMRDVFYPNRPYPVSVVIRALLVTVLFRKQAESYMEEFASLPNIDDDEDDVASVCQNGFSRDRMELVTQKCKNLIKVLFQFCNSWNQVKETILSNEIYLGSLEFVLGEADYQDMSPEKLGELIIGNK